MIRLETTDVQGCIHSLDWSAGLTFSFVGKVTIFIFIACIPNSIEAQQCYLYSLICIHHTLGWLSLLLHSLRFVYIAIQ